MKNMDMEAIATALEGLAKEAGMNPFEFIAKLFSGSRKVDKPKQRRPKESDLEKMAQEQDEDDDLPNFPL